MKDKQVSFIEVDEVADEDEEIEEDIPSKPFIVKRAQSILLHIGRYFRPRTLGRVSLGLS